ncbi:MAG: hypothetical protein PHT02_00885 [Tissierellia bacterium]|nr:hypothetical protein [Tissierellia bacterium]
MNNYNEINKLTDEELLTFCNEIFEYQNGNGDLNKNSNFYKFFIEHKNECIWNIRDFKTVIIDLAYNRFEKVVKLLIINRPYWVIKK